MMKHSASFCVEGMSVPKWNTFTRSLVVGCMDLAHKFLADEGFLVTMGVAEHIGDLIAEASRVGLVLLRTWTLMCHQTAYRHPLTREAVRYILDLFNKFNNLEQNDYLTHCLSCLKQMHRC